MRQAELLPAPYFHVVFTVPPLAAEIAFHNKRVVYAILFRAAADALRDIAADPRHLGAEIGAVAVLHTWGQALQHHPHLHCIVPGGGLSPDQTQWVACRPGFFVPVRVLSRRFRTLFLERLRAAFATGELRFSGALADLAEPARFAACLGALSGAEWVVYSKRPFAGPEQVLAYLGRYTHRVAIANSRLARLADGEVSFTWKDYRHDGKTTVMTLAAGELMRRFLLHTVPDGFHRIRHLGFLANGHRAAKLARCRAFARGAQVRAATDRELSRAPPTPDRACPGPLSRMRWPNAAARARCARSRRPVLRSGATPHDGQIIRPTQYRAIFSRLDARLGSVCPERAEHQSGIAERPHTIPGNTATDPLRRTRGTLARAQEPTMPASSVATPHYTVATSPIALSARGLVQSGFNEVAPQRQADCRPSPATSQKPPDSGFPRSRLLQMSA